MLFSIGKKVVYPTHGVARVEAIEEKVVSGERQAFYVLRILGNGMTVMVPTRKAQQVRLREVIRRAEVPKIMAILRRNDLEICSNWNRRYKDNQERIRSGSLYEVALVLRKLVLLQKDRNLSFG
ncbi:MAG: CarD family transcriptional regulator, partial [candidate division NC10 bacterium]|nr:CarD family transcriptional regulator [candidate division NC10 bacterium]